MTNEQFQNLKCGDVVTCGPLGYPWMVVQLGSSRKTLVRVLDEDEAALWDLAPEKSPKPSPEPPKPDAFDKWWASPSVESGNVKDLCRQAFEEGQKCGE